MTPIERALSILGPLTDRQRATRCPFDGHEDKHKSATLYPDQLWCHACSRGMSPLDVYAHQHGLTISQALKQLGVTSGRPPKPKPRTPALDEFYAAFAAALPEGELAAAHYIIDLAKTRRWKSKSLDEVLTDTLSHPSFTQACRNKGLNPVLIHDLIFMEVA